MLHFLLNYVAIFATLIIIFCNINKKIMKKLQRQAFILELLQRQEKVKVSDILERFKIDRTTIYRDFQELVKENKIREIAK
jgi:DNA invertase Pin-like site-specific DNA recombinase